MFTSHPVRHTGHVIRTISLLCLIRCCTIALDELRERLPLLLLSLSATASSSSSSAPDSICVFVCRLVSLLLRLWLWLDVTISTSDDLLKCLKQNECGITY